VQLVMQHIVLRKDARSDFGLKNLLSGTRVQEALINPTNKFSLILCFLASDAVHLLQQHMH
jgi:hypothetical protein